VTASDPEAPEDVRLVIGGREYPCDVLRDPGQDHDGCAAWLVVPRQPLPPIGEGQLSIKAALLPAKSLLMWWSPGRPW